MISPNAWNNLPETEKLAEFEKAKKLAGLRTKIVRFWPCGEATDEPREHIFRPLMALGRWTGLKHLLDRDYPDGEFHEFHDEPPTLKNYTILYDWHLGNCIFCGSSNVDWDQSDKSLCTYCSHCRREKPFIKGAWY
jgi:hypothetical protein